MIFLIPLVASIIGGVFFLFAADAEMKWKLMVLGLVLVAAVCQFIPPLAGNVPMLVPVMIQIVICIGLVLYFQLDNL